MTCALALDLLKAAETDGVRVMVEMNFQGKNYVTSMRQHPLYFDGLLQKTYHTKPVPGEVRRRRIGFKSGPEKEHFCQLGAKMIARRRIVPRDRTTLGQLEQFGYVKGKIKGIACHDDLSYPIINHIPVMMDDETFMSWIEDFLYNLTDEKRKYEINMYIKKWEMENPEMTDESFAAMYGLNDRSELFGGGINTGTPFQQSQQPQYQYYNGINPYSSGYNGG